MSPAEFPILALRAVECPPALLTASAEFIAGSFHIIAGAPAETASVLRVLGLLEAPAGGEVLLAGQPTRELPAESRAALRNRWIGFLFAAPFLLPALSVMENLALPLFKLAPTSAEDARARAEVLLAAVGLEAHASTAAGALDPWQQHCAALARALLHAPGALLVEALDTRLPAPAAERFATLAQQLAAERGIALIASAGPGWECTAASEALLLRLSGGALCPESFAFPPAS